MFEAPMACFAGAWRWNTLSQWCQNVFTKFNSPSNSIVAQRLASISRLSEGCCAGISTVDRYIWWVSCSTKCLTMFACPKTDHVHLLYPHLTLYTQTFLPFVVIIQTITWQAKGTCMHVHKKTSISGGHNGSWHADTSGTSSECAVKLIIDPVTRTLNGHAVVNMKSADQATWVMKDLNDMLFVVSTGPRPIQASMAMAGMGCLLAEWSLEMWRPWMWMHLLSLLVALMLHRTTLCHRMLCHL